jgi:hypothetical protein
MDEDTALTYVMDEDLKHLVDEDYINEGALFGTVAQDKLTSDAMLLLEQLGWKARDYRDRPVIESPRSTIDWDGLSGQHRDRILHAISHKLPEGSPWAGNKQAIIEELIASIWEQHEEELRILLSAWTFAAAWSGHPDQGDRVMESRQTFFFYSSHMREAADKAVVLITDPPVDDDNFWIFMKSLEG